MLPLTFVDPEDYERVQEADRVSLVGLSDLAPGKVGLWLPCTKSSLYSARNNSTVGEQ